MKLAEWLYENRMLQTTFAELVGVGPEAVRLWLRGKGRPANPQYDAILAVTGGQVTPNDFLPSSDASAANTGHPSGEGKDAA